MTTYSWVSAALTLHGFEPHFQKLPEAFSSVRPWMPVLSLSLSVMEDGLVCGCCFRVMDLVEYGCYGGDTEHSHQDRSQGHSQHCSVVTPSTCSRRGQKVTSALWLFGWSCMYVHMHISVYIGVKCIATNIKKIG